MAAALDRVDEAPAIPDDDIPELTEADFASGTWHRAGQPLNDAEGRAAAAVQMRRRGRPSVNGGKQHINLRIDQDVIDAFKATGPGWQSRMNDVLRRGIGL